MKFNPLYIIIFLLYSFLLGLSVTAQNLDLNWAKRMGGISNDAGNAIVVDGDGNSYTTGSFQGTVDFDPGPGTFNLTSTGQDDIFILKLDILGNFVFALKMGGLNNDVANSIAVDINGNIYTTGRFWGIADFDPGSSIYNLTSFGVSDVFVSKLDPIGNFIWAKQMGGANSDNLFDVGYSIAIDPNGNIYTTGAFSSTADFDPGPGIYNFTAAGNVDLFISKLDVNGNFIWAKQVGGGAGEIGYGITIDANQNIILTGLLGSTNVDFDPGTGIFLLSGDGAFVLKLNNAGNFMWAKALAEDSGFPTSSGWGLSIGLDSDGSIYTTGVFQGTFDFDPGPSTFNLTTLTNVLDSYISKLDSSGDFLWVKKMSATTSNLANHATSIAIGTNGNIYTTGFFTGTTDFDPGVETYYLTPAGSFDVFVSTLDKTGNFIGVKQIGGIDFDRGASIKTDAFGNIYLTGAFNQTTDFDPCTGSYSLTAAGNTDIFVVKFASPSIDITASSTTICPGTSVTFTAAPTNAGPSPSYQWQVNGVNVATNSPTYTTNILNNGDVVRVILTSNATCVPPTIATSNSITMTVNASVPTSVVISTPATTICAGTSVTFTATPTNGGTNPVYQWQVNGVNVGTNSPTYTTNTLVNGDLVTVNMTSNSTCATPLSAISNAITMTVSPGGSALVSISTASSTICAGALVTFTATPTNGGPTLSFQWQVNGSNAGTNSQVFTTNTLSNGDVVRVIMTSSLSCATGSPATSNSITMNVVPPGPASVSISSTSPSTCSGTSVTFMATPTNGGAAPAYQWKVNGVNAGTNSSTFTTTSLANGDVITVIMTSSLNCATGSPATSNSITMTVTPSVTPSVNIDASSTAICIGAAVTFTATPTNGGTTPAYQWKVNGANVGTNSSAYTTTSLSNGDVVTVMMTSNATCPLPATATSNGISISVSPPVTPSLNITVPSTTICVGTKVNFSATATNGGSLPLYQWQVNGANVGTNSSYFTTNSLVNGDVVTSIMTSNAACATVNTVTSNPITMTVINNTVTPSVSIASSPGNICLGTVVTFTATPINGGSTPSYQWQLNGANTGTNSPTFISNTLSNGDIISCLMTSNTICAVPNTVPSNNIMIIIDPTVCPTGFFMPTAFTPNKDGKNDIYKPTLLGNVLSYKFSIYNRWGQKIFETTELQKGWDGKVSGLETDSNVFIWVCSFQFAGHTLEIRKGTVMLIR